MKKLLIFLLAAMMIVCSCACGEDMVLDGTSASATNGEDCSE